MTATTTALPYPLVGEQPENYEQLYALPVGSQVGFDGGDCWAKQPDGVWMLPGNEDITSHTTDFTVPCVDWVVLSIPTLSLAELVALPAGARVFWPRGIGHGVYVKRWPNIDPNETVWLATDGSADERNCQMEGCLLVSNPLAPPAPVGPVNLAPASVAPGMYLDTGDGFKLYVLSRDGERIRTLRIAGPPERAIIETARNVADYNPYRLIEPDTDLVSAIGARVTDANALDTARNEGRREANQRWSNLASAFNTAFWGKVDGDDFDGEAADELAESHEEILESRYQDWQVNFTVTASVSRTVRARDEDAATESAWDELQISSGNDVSIGYEDAYISDIAVDEVERI